MNLLHTLFGQRKDLNGLNMVCRAVVSFFLTLLLIRIAGIRTFGKKTPFDNVIIIMVGSIFGLSGGRFPRNSDSHGLPCLRAGPSSPGMVMLVQKYGRTSD